MLDPIERVSEVLFGLIMVLTFTGSLSVAEAGRDDIRTMLIGALGCNLAWGIIDAILYLMGCLAEKGRSLTTLQAVRKASDPQQAQRLIADALAAGDRVGPGAGGARGRAPAADATARAADRARLPRTTGWAALGVFLLVFLSTFPVVIPFIVMQQRRAGAARFERHRDRDVVRRRLCRTAGARAAPWMLGIAMVLLGALLSALTMALGG